MLYIAARKVWSVTRWIWVTLIVVFLVSLAANLAVVQTATVSKTVLASLLLWFALFGFAQIGILVVFGLFLITTVSAWVITMLEKRKHNKGKGSTSDSQLRHYLLNEGIDASLEQATNDFVGRHFLFDEVDKWLKSSTIQSGYLVIEAEPGFGKTAFIAALVKRSGWIHHYVDLKRGINKPQEFLENVCAQLIIRYKLPTTRIQDVEVRPNTVLDKLLTDVVSKARNKPVVILVDALDEASDTGLTDGANRLFLPPSLPIGVFIIVTTRPEAPSTSPEEKAAKRSVLEVNPVKVLPIKGTDPRNKADVRKYIGKYIREHHSVMNQRMAEWNMSTSQFVEMLLQKSEGNFLYTVLVLRDVYAGAITRETIDDLDHLPDGLRGYYLSHWRRMKVSSPERFEHLYKPVACFLAAAQAPLSVREIARFTGLTPDEVNIVLHEWRQFFGVSKSKDGEPDYRFYHASFRDFLYEEESVGLKHYYERIKADFYRSMGIRPEWELNK
jgi:hypothetical protein